MADFFYDREGNSITQERWMQLLGDDEYRIIAFTDLGPAHVSTIWLGLGVNPVGPPMIYETMVMAPGHEEWHTVGRRYPSKEAAERGHDELVRQVRAAIREGDAYT